MFDMSKNERISLNFYAFADSSDGITLWLMLIVEAHSKPLTEMKLVEGIAKN